MGFKASGGGSTGNLSVSISSVIEVDFGFEGWASARVEDFTGNNSKNSTV
jgi:hypothetical protein